MIIIEFHQNLDNFFTIQESKSQNLMLSALKTMKLFGTNNETSRKTILEPR